MAIDADTLARAQRGDRDARRALVAAHAPRVIEVVGDAAAAEAVLAAVLADLPKYRLGADRLATWIETRARSRSPSERSGSGSGSGSGPDLDPLIERVLDAPVPVEAARPKLRLGLAAAVVAAAAVAVIVVAMVRAPAPPAGPRTGAVTATARSQIRIAAGVAVVEPGARITWTDGAIEQPTGSVYYRIERPATITTPHGAIHTAHASARVVVAASTVVTIDEGGAVVGSTAVSAGARAELP